MRTQLAFAAALLLAGSAVAQDAKEGLTKKPRKVPAHVGSAPVTLSEANVVFSKAVRMFDSVLGTKGNSTKIGTGAKPITRDQVIGEMGRLFGVYQAKFKFTPKVVAYQPGVLKTGPTQKATLSKLVAWGFVAPIGPLATGPGSTMTVRDFGDCIGFFISRMADLTHTPTKFNPALMPDR